MIQFNKNAFGLAPGVTAVPLGQVAPGATSEATVPVALSPAQVAPGAAPNVLQARVRPCQTAFSSCAQVRGRTWHDGCCSERFVPQGVHVQPLNSMRPAPLCTVTKVTEISYG